MRAPILNRFQHPTDGWYQIETPGEHPNTAAKVVQVIDATATASIVNRFNQEADDYKRRTGKPFPGMLIDIEHFKHDSDKETRAYGWLMRLENRNGVPFGKINWTATGQPAVDGGDYRFFSTEYDPGDLQVLNNGTPRRVRPLRLDGLTLTNDPNNKGGSPITNRNFCGTYATQEDWEAAGRENMRQLEVNKTAVADAAAKRQAYTQGEEAEFALPAVEKWFRAVNSIVKNVAKQGSIALSFDAAWQIAKQKFPALYAEAFAPVTDGAGADDAKAASDRVAMLTNRIKQSSGADFQFAWNFLRENLPRVFNRQLTPAQRVLNRAETATDGPALMNRASRVFSRLAQAEKELAKSSLEMAWHRTAGLHPGLQGLAKGSLTLAQARRVGAGKVSGPFTRRAPQGI